MRVIALTTENTCRANVPATAEVANCATDPQRPLASTRIARDLLEKSVF